MTHLCLWCEHLPSVSKAQSSIPSSIKPIIYCGQLGVVVQTCNPVLRAVLRPGTESRGLSVRLFKKLFSLVLSYIALPLGP